MTHLLLPNLKVIDAQRLTPAQQTDLQHLLDLARSDPYLRDDESPVVREGERREVIVYNHVLVGFYSPRRQSYLGDIRWRAGALFLAPEYRGQGVMEHVLKGFFATHPSALTWIDDTNVRSINLFVKLGFVKVKPCKAKDGGDGHWYLLNPPAKLVVLEHPNPAYFNWK